jgi:hypothetical protein
MSFPHNRLWLLAAPLALAAGVAAAAVEQKSDTGVDLSLAARLSPGQTLKEARNYKLKMQDTKTRIDKLLSKARDKKDVIMIVCVEDKSVRVKGHIAVADQAMSTLDTAVQRSDDGVRQHEFMRITILFQKVVVLGTEAENCIGEDVSYVGDTKVEQEVDPSIPADDPSEPALPLPDVTRPPAATPFV